MCSFARDQTVKIVLVKGLDLPSRLMHPLMESGYLARVKVTNMSESTERFEQIIHTLEQVNKQESQFKYIRNDKK